jgi:hypothetical protein
VSRKFEICAALTFLTIAAFGFAQAPPTAVPTRPAVTISVYDYAHVPAELLAAAEMDAQRIFRQAGVEIVWLNCLPKREKIEPNSCHSVDASHLMMKILPGAINSHVRDRSDVLGDALVDEKGGGFFAYVFYDNVRRIAEEHRLGHALLGGVLAHETGHLLLGSKSHTVSGIMSAHWSGDELRRISEGNIFFAPSQSRVLRDRVASREIDSPAVTLATAGLSTRGLREASK